LSTSPCRTLGYPIFLLGATGWSPQTKDEALQPRISIAQNRNWGWRRGRSCHRASCTAGIPTSCSLCLLSGHEGWKEETIATGHVDGHGKVKVIGQLMSNEVGEGTAWLWILEGNSQKALKQAPSPELKYPTGMTKPRQLWSGVPGTPTQA
jgi:hypothetical protein